jgi:hypothetical protein
MSRRSGSGRRRWDAPPPTTSSSSSESSASLPATAPASTFSGRHDDDTVGSLTAVLARSVLIRKLVLMPKMKAAMLFQPEDHVARERVKAQFGRTLFGGANRRSARLTQLVHFGGIFGAGALLFLGQEVALSWLMSGSLTQHVDVDTAPALKSGIAGSFGGLLYAATATPLVRTAVKHSLGWREANCVEVLQSLHRPNILLQVHVPGNVSGKGDSLKAKSACVVAALKRPGVVLVFVGTVYTSAAVAVRLRSAAPQRLQLRRASRSYCLGQNSSTLKARLMEKNK